MGSNPTLSANFIMLNIIKDFFVLFQDFPESEAVQSIKLKNKSINHNRYGILIEKEILTFGKLKNILKNISCPVGEYEIHNRYKDCSHIAFALELDSKINYRVYFKKKYNQKNFNLNSFVIYDSYKWDENNNCEILKTNYEFFRNLDSEGIIKKINETKLFLPTFIKKIITDNDISQKYHFLNTKKYLNEYFLYKSVNNNCGLFIAKDTGSNRLSYNISLPLFPVLDLPKEVGSLFNLKNKNIFNGFEDKKNDDISIGIDKYQENFITFYFENQKVIDFLKQLSLI